MSTTCPCGSGRPYDRCCGPIHRGEHPADTAEALMRSRYSAYALGLNDYLLHSWHPDTRPEGLDGDTLKWVRLEIVSTDRGGADDEDGTVRFRAWYIAADRLGSLAETSRFLRHEGRWVYVDGDLEPDGPESLRPIGRNAPCPCGSGAKYKRCCGK